MDDGGEEVSLGLLTLAVDEESRMSLPVAGSPEDRALARWCTSCGARLRPRARFCGACGAAVALPRTAGSADAPQPAGDGTEAAQLASRQARARTVLDLWEGELDVADRSRESRLEWRAEDRSAVDRSADGFEDRDRDSVAMARQRLLEALTARDSERFRALPPPASAAPSERVHASSPGRVLWETARLNQREIRSCAKQETVLDPAEDSFCGIGRDLCAIAEALVRDFLLPDLTAPVVDAALRFTRNAAFARRAPDNPSRASLGQLAAWVGALEAAAEAEDPLVVGYLCSRLGDDRACLQNHALSLSLNAICPLRNALAHGRALDNTQVFEICETLLGPSRVHTWWEQGAAAGARPLVQMLAARAQALEAWRQGQRAEA